MVQQTLRNLWDAALNGDWEALPWLHYRGEARLQDNEAALTALRESARPLLWTQRFIKEAPAGSPQQAIEALSAEMGLDAAQTHEARVAAVREALAGWSRALEDGRPDGADLEPLAGRLVEAVYLSIRHAYEAVREAAQEARTLDALGHIHDEAAAPLRSPRVRAWWEDDGIPDLRAHAVEDALHAFGRKHAFFAENAPLLDEKPGITLAEFIRRANAAGVELSALPPGQRLTDLVEPLNALDQTVAGLQQDLESALQNLGRDLIRAREARAALLRIEANQALTRAWATAYAFDLTALNQALNEASRALEELDTLVVGTGRLVVEMEKLWDSYGRLQRAYEALANLSPAAQEDLQTWRANLLAHTALEPAERGSLIVLIKKVAGTELADALNMLLELDARLRLERRVAGEVHAQLQAEQEVYAQYNALRKALLADPAEGTGASEEALTAMWRQVPALSEAMRPLVRDLIRQWGNIDAAAGFLRTACQTLALQAPAAPDPAALLDALHFHLHAAAPEAFYLAYDAWEAALTAVEARIDAVEIVEAMRDTAYLKQSQGWNAFFDISEGPADG